MSTPVRPGAVEWTGDNPFIYLKTDPAGEWSTLALFFRITGSRLGAGSMLLVLEDPYAGDSPGAARLCLTDSEPLAQMLLDGFVRRFPLFRPAGAALDALAVTAGASFEGEGDGRSWHAERAHAGGRTAELRWDGLGEPFAVVVPPASSATGEHEMLSVFAVARSASVTVDGTRLAGATIERDFLNGRGQSAALALSETWVRPD
jgi:hypothetical protein